MLFPFLFLLLFSCGGDNDFIEDINTLYEETTKTTYDTIYQTRLDSLGNEIVDTIISENTEELRNDLKVVVDSICHLFNVGGPGSLQGADCYNGTFFHFCKGFNWVSIYDMESGNRIALLKFSGNKNGLNYHCNNADFSNVFYNPDDEFPLIYVSQSTPRHISVGRISRVRKTYTIDVVQTIIFSNENSIISSPDVVLDNDNGFMYAYAYGREGLQLYKYKIPDCHGGEEIILTDNDIIETFDIGNVSYRQGATIRNGFLYMVDGVPNWGTDVYLRIVNLSNHSYSRINLTRACGVLWEPEDLFFYEGELYCAANFNRGVHKVYISFNR